jgi:hypothetical protein
LPEKSDLFGREILLVRAVKKTFQLFDDLLGYRIIFHFKIGRCLPDIDRFPTPGTELPLLVPVDIRERTAAWTPDDEIHHYWLIASPLVYILRVRESGAIIRRICHQRISLPVRLPLCDGDDSIAWREHEKDMIGKSGNKRGRVPKKPVQVTRFRTRIKTEIATVTTITATGLM